MRQRSVLAACLAACAVGAIAAPARAQVGLALPPLVEQERRGVRFGEFVFVPFVGVEGRYNSNVFRQDSREGRSEAGILTIRPGFLLVNPTPSWVKLSWDGSVDVNFWFSKDSKASDQGRVAASTTLRLDVLPRSVVGFYVMDTFLRSVQPQNYSTSQVYDRNFNHAEAGLQVRPGSALELDLGYAYNIDLFDDFKDGDRSFHEVRFVTLWQFFPRTAFYLDANWRYQQWDRAKAGYRSDSMPLRAAAGVRGYVTKKLALEVRAGYGQGFYKQGSDVQTFIGEASLAWKPTPFTVLDVGYERGFEDAAFYARWYTYDRARLTVKQQFVRRLELEGAFAYSYLSYARLRASAADVPGYATLVANQADRRDHALMGRVSLAYSALRYLNLKVGYQYDGIVTDFRLDGTTLAGTSSADYGGWHVHQVFAEIQALY